MSLSVSSKSRTENRSKTDRSSSVSTQARISREESSTKSPKLLKGEHRLPGDRFEARQRPLTHLQVPARADRAFQGAPVYSARNFSASTASTASTQARPLSTTQAQAAQPTSQGWANKAPVIDQLRPNGWEEFKQWDAAGNRHIMQNGKSNCGPTSAAMVARAIGYGEGKTDAQLIRELGRVGGTTAAGSTPEGVANMVRHAGAQATVVYSPKDLRQLDAALAAGKMVIANGDYHATGVPGRDGSKMSGHFCVVTGKDAQGNYIVNEPWNGKQMKFTPEAMLNYFREHRVSDGSRQGAMIIVDKVAPGHTPGAPAPTTPTAPTAPGGNASNTVPPAGLRHDGGRSYNRDVEQLQKLLVKTGYMKESDRLTGPGHYGNRTAAALAALQRDYGVAGDGRTFDAATRAALEQKLAGQAPVTAPPGGAPAPTGAYERAVVDAIANAPKDNASLRQHWAQFAADHVAPRLEALGVPREQIQKAILWGLTEGTSTVSNNGKYFLENGARSNPITYSNLGENLEANRSTQTHNGYLPSGNYARNWQVGLAGVQVNEAVRNGWLKDSFQKLYPNMTPQQVGQRMLDLMGSSDRTFPNLTIDQLSERDAQGRLVHGKWAAILLRDPAINVMSMTNHPNLDHWLNVNRQRLEGEQAGFYNHLQGVVNNAFA